MLKKLVIWNFQCHKKLEVNFDQRVTTIVGPNDAGKSAIIRALRLITLNKPIGRSFIRHGSKQCSIQLFLGKSRLKRVVGSNGHYSLNGKTFKAFRNNVPSEIASLLSIEEVNYQKQHDASFWFSLTPGQVARELNKLVDLESIDRIQAAVNKRIKDKQAELRVSRERLEEAEHEIKQLAWVTPLDVKLGKLQRLEQLATSPTASILASLVRNGSDQASTARRSSQAATEAHSTATAARTAKQAGNRAGTLKAVISALRRCSGVLQTNIPDHSEIDRLASQVKTTTNQTERLGELVEQLSEKEKCLCQVNKKLKKRGKVLETRLGGRCYACGGILSDRSLI